MTKEGSAPTPQEATLSREEIAQTAFTLIYGFETTLRKAPDFKTALMEAYFGADDTKESRRVRFSRGHSQWMFNLINTSTSRELYISREISGPNGESEEITNVALRSARHFLVETYRVSPKIEAFTIGNDVDTTPDAENPVLAVDTIRKLLAEFKASEPDLAK